MATCDNCVSPVASASGPGVIMPACSGSTFSPVTFNALLSTDPTGRALTNVEWYFNSTGTLAPDAAAATYVRNNILPASSDPLASRGSFTITSTHIANAAFKDGTYRITLRVTNFLGKTAIDTLVFRKQAVGTVPMVELQTPNSFVVSDGLPISALVKQSSVCGTKATQFTFSVGSTAFPTQTRGDIFFSQAQLWAAGVRAGGSANVSVVVAFTDSPRVTYSTWATVDAQGDPLIASLAGSRQGLLPSTGFINFTADASQDPSDPSNTEAMRFAWSCARPDAPLLSCFTDRGYQGNRNGSLWTVDASRFVAGISAQISVTISKGTGSRLRTATAKVAINTQSARQRRQLLQSGQAPFSVQVGLMCGFNLQTGLPNVCGSDASSSVPVSLSANINFTQVSGRLFPACAAHRCCCEQSPVLRCPATQAAAPRPRTHAAPARAGDWLDQHVDQPRQLHHHVGLPGLVHDGHGPGAALHHGGGPAGPVCRHHPARRPARLGRRDRRAVQRDGLDRPDRPGRRRRAHRAPARRRPAHHGRHAQDAVDHGRRHLLGHRVGL